MTRDNQAPKIMMVTKVGAVIIAVMVILVTILALLQHDHQPGVISYDSDYVVSQLKSNYAIQVGYTVSDAECTETPAASLNHGVGNYFCTITFAIGIAEQTTVNVNNLGQLFVQG